MSALRTYVYAPCMFSAHKSQNRASDFQELELEMVRCCMDAENKTRVL